MRLVLPGALLAASVVFLPYGQATRSTLRSELFPTPASGITIPSSSADDGGFTLADLVGEYERSANVDVITSEETQQILASTRVNLDRGAELAPAKVHTIVQTLLVKNGFILGLAHDEAPLMFTLSSMNSNQRHSLRQSAVYVPVDELPLWKAHPAFMVTTAFAFETVDARLASNSMRAMLIDVNTQMIQACGDSNVVLLTGMTGDVLKWVELLRVADSEAAKWAENSVEPEPRKPR